MSFDAASVRRVWLDKDEWWPVYSISHEDSYGRSVELSEEFIRRFELAAAEFEECQRILRKADRGE